MSISEIEEGGGRLPDVSDINTMEPVIKDQQGNRVEPAYVETLRATTQNDNLVHKSLCGQTEVEAVGEDEWNVNIEGIVLQDQLETLFEMRPANNKITVIGDARTHRNVDFDRFTYEQKDELNRGNFSYKGQEVTQPLFEFQLQTQDDQQG